MPRLCSSDRKPQRSCSDRPSRSTDHAMTGLPPHAKAGGRAEVFAADTNVAHQIAKDLPGATVLDGRFNVVQMSLAVPKQAPASAFCGSPRDLRLAKGYGVERLDAAYRRGNDIGAHSYGSIASILKHGLD